jgi:hypothetical protein
MKKIFIVISFVVMTILIVFGIFVLTQTRDLRQLAEFMTNIIGLAILPTTLVVVVATMIYKTYWNDN